LVIAVNVGVLLAMLVFMRRMASSVHLELQEEKVLREQNSFDVIPSGVVVYSMNGPFFWTQ
jgi:SulP family sulfate permease